MGFRAGIFYKGEFRHIGMYATEKKAARAYDREAKKLWGEFACLNFQGGVLS